ncbi:CRISPR system precrRNA processing endoribonuclease RAMP protein Cas6 [Succinimonas amylolytica]|uniref:CRISPR system precrRNA processing endoribonuclease RAMP protein Cas6 n=1 Tax=Succinimonas amylolytica TaxID=83769 RepID=UPI00036BD8E5|nr:CRISPR system precrRNA processing endoribonuclease RAMP protein Cas6 [Succinimonas amylolytica]
MQKLSRLKIRLQIPDNVSLSCTRGSLFHGALMNMIDSDYANFLHESRLHPYAQYISREEDGAVYWVISCTNEEACSRIIAALMSRDSVFIEKLNAEVGLGERSYSELSYDSLAALFYGDPLPRFTDIRIITPMSFKSEGGYCIFPDIRKIYKSMMNRYDTAMKDSSSTVFDLSALNELCETTAITRYNLRSRMFPVDGASIPSFSGTISLRFSGSKSMINFAHMLFRFGEFSGVGVKTSIGMGAIRIENNNGGMKHVID